jgi:quercetin dioxygenase-like cupin family protein
MTEVRLTAWPSAELPTEASLWERMSSEGLRPYLWSNAPFDTYAAHSHDYDKVIYVVQGSITFGLPLEARRVELLLGDRLDLPASTVHDAQVGGHGVICLEARK